MFSLVLFKRCVNMGNDFMDLTKFFEEDGLVRVWGESLSFIVDVKEVENE